MASAKWGKIIPVAFIMYMLAYMDRINIGVLMPYIQKDLDISSSAAGDIAGIFFVGYLILQIPGGILATKWSAKKFIFILMILWGLAAMATGFVQTEGQLKFVRFLLGVAEGGVWPAVLVLLANWFTLKERARANAFWMACLPVSAMLMAPLSGLLLKHFDWKTVLILEGVPPLIWAFVWYAMVKDKPSEAKWMSDQERNELTAELQNEQKGAVKSSGYGAAFKNMTVWGLVVMYFFWMTGFYGYTLWVPSVVSTFTKDSAVMGWLTAIPFTFALVGMVLNSYWSDRRMNRVQHVVIPLLIGAAAMVAGQFVESPALQMILLSITAIGVYAPYGPLWAIPTAIIPAGIVGAALGLQNAIGNLGGYNGPKFVGLFKDLTGSFHAGFYFLAASLVLAAIITLILGRSIQASQKASSDKPKIHKIS
ncbi:MFS transporter [Fictibacillus sp. WQ 8-8]|uniref:MFS transporter n=1 Tax=Fictibacillus marinisediminis TaxID=2878389 RepID=A0A9X1XHP7_9BACL|nr:MULTISPECIES: MFS transporter [Fictibacillus]MCK6259125.1 MFS transporter [Fictibacillus marinisediminis]MCQ6264815.1 MFS transporter [Fictibacillus sp. WQ 8-8]SFE88082.1 Sugar phosphate permease [Bacillus sp. OV194]